MDIMKLFQFLMNLSAVKFLSPLCECLFARHTCSWIRLIGQKLWPESVLLE